MYVPRVLILGVGVQLCGHGLQFCPNASVLCESVCRFCANAMSFVDLCSYFVWMQGFFVDLCSNFVRMQVSFVDLCSNIACCVFVSSNFERNSNFWYVPVVYLCGFVFNFARVSVSQ